MAIDLVKLLETAAEQVSQQSLKETVDLLWTTESRFSFPSFQATGRHMLARLREWGGPENADAQPIKIRSRGFELPADGRSMYGDWKAPLGWSCISARLEIHDPLTDRGRVLGDFKKQPLQIVAWSGPTPPDGIVAPVVRIEDAAELETRAKEVRGRIVFTPADPRLFKKRLAELGVAGVVTSFCPEASHLPKACAWIGSWSDDPQGTAFIDGDTPLPAMVISPEQGVELEILMEREQVRLKLLVDAHYSEATVPVVCGYIDAELQEEVLAVAHAFAPGANANISGSAVVMESLHALQEATRSGALPPIRRGIRGMLLYERSGAIGFGLLNPGILRRIHAAINWTGVGRYSEHSGNILCHHEAPHAGPTVADTLLALLMEAWLPRALPHLQFRLDQPYALFDNATCDPRLGVPCPAVAGRDRQRHTSEDTPKDLSAPALHAFTTISVAYLHFLASATAKESMWLAQQTLRRFGKRIEDLGSRYALRLSEDGADQPALLAQANAHLMYTRSICEATVMSSKRFMLREERQKGHLALLKLLRHIRRLVDLEKRRLKELANCEAGELPAVALPAELATSRPYRKFSGPPAYGNVSPVERKQLSRPELNAPLHAAVYWSEGELTFAEIVRQVSYEFDGDFTADLLAHFRFMAEHGMIQWLQPGDAVPKPPKPEKTDNSGMSETEPPAEEPVDESEEEADEEK
jgi:hypothetical protein